MTTPVDSKEFSNIAANTATFVLKGGVYAIAAVATFGGGSVELQALGPTRRPFCRSLQRILLVRRSSSRLPVRSKVTCRRAPIGLRLRRRPRFFAR
jgi:hypothetical protein